MDNRAATTKQIIAALGGSQAVAAMFHVGVNAVSNWRITNLFPPDTFLVMSDELAKRGVKPDLSLWRFRKLADKLADESPASDTSLSAGHPPSPR